MDKIYVTELDKPPLDEDTLAHYGVMGMKWGVRKNPEKAFAKAAKKSDKYAKKIYKTNKKYLKEAKKVSRFFGRKKAQDKVVRLNAKKDALTAKKEKWDKNIEKIFSKEYDRIRTKSKTDEEKDTRLSRLSKGYTDSSKPTTTKTKSWDNAKTVESKTQLKKDIASKIKKSYLNDDFDGYVSKKNPESFDRVVSKNEISDIQKQLKREGYTISSKDIKTEFEKEYNKKYKR